MKLRAIWGIVLFSFLMNGLTADDAKILTKIGAYPQKDSDYYFKGLTDLAISGDILYELDNSACKAVKFAFDGRNIIFLKEIGRPGQGPGDLMLPMSLAITKNGIAVFDDAGISFFSADGSFQDRFKTIPTIRDRFTYLDDEIYIKKFQTSDHHLIEVRSRTGSLLRTVGRKYLRFDPASFIDRDPAAVEAQAYEGPLVTDGESIYYLNSAFGDIKKFDNRGMLLAENNLVSSFGEFGQAIFEANQDLYFHGGLDRVSNKRMYPSSGVWRDAAVENGKLYIMADYFAPKIGKSKTIDILAVDLNTLKPMAKFRFPLEKEDRPQCLAVSERNGVPIFLIAMHTAEGYEIGIYATEK
jgi:hypothetical protein